MTATEDADMIGPKLGEGREAEIYAWGTEAVLKLYRPGFGGHHAESLALAALDGHPVAPRLIEVTEHGERTGIVLERLCGTDMLTLLQRQPWQVRSLATTLAETHLHIHSRQAPAGLADLRQLLAERISDAGLPAPSRGFALGVLDRLPDGDRLCHGDYHPGNVLVSATGTAVIDWAAAARGVPEADHARTLLLLRWANPLPGTPLMFRGLIAAGRSLLAGTYSRRYRQACTEPLRRMDSWLTVNIAARLSEGIDAERAKLISLLDRARHRAQ
jgi:Phosphotransferase enzyme family